MCLQGGLVKLQCVMSTSEKQGRTMALANVTHKRAVRQDSLKAIPIGRRRTRQAGVGVGDPHTHTTVTLHHNHLPMPRARVRVRACDVVRRVRVRACHANVNTGIRSLLTLLTPATGTRSLLTPTGRFTWSPSRNDTVGVVADFAA